LWLKRGDRNISTIDLFRGSFVLLAAPEGAAWLDAAGPVRKESNGLELDAHLVGGPDIRDPEGRFATAYGLTSSGCALVRPDGFVVWRAKAAVQDPENVLAKAFRTILMQS
jgi:putative polyketide hydroxylase